MGSFSLTGIAEGNYLFKVEKDGQFPVLGACYLSGDSPHKINVRMLEATSQRADTSRAGAPLRDASRPPGLSSLPKVKFPQLKKKVAPLYPDAARKMKAAGTVRISMIIMPDGTVDDLVVLSTPNDDLAIAALMAVKLWRYSPAYLDGEASETNLTVDVNFGR